MHMILITLPHRSVVDIFYFLFEYTIHRFLSHFAFSHLYYGTTILRCKHTAWHHKSKPLSTIHSVFIYENVPDGANENAPTARPPSAIVLFVCKMNGNRFFACTANVLNAEHLLKDSFILFGNLRNNIIYIKVHHTSCTVHYKRFSFHLTFFFFLFMCAMCSVLCNAMLFFLFEAIQFRFSDMHWIVRLHSCALCMFLICVAHFQFSFSMSLTLN